MTLSSPLNTIKSQPSGSLHGSVRVPGDKSISHRSLMLSAIAIGVSEIQGLLMGADNIATLTIMRALGVQIDELGEGHFRVHGRGMHGLQAPSQILDCGNAGTGMRLITGLLAGQQFNATLTGDESLVKRPMRRIVSPLKAMGAQIDTTDSGTAPLVITGNQLLNGIEYSLPMASAQVKSALLLAGMYAAGVTTIIEPAPSRDHTERMLQAFGYPLTINDNHISIEGGKSLTATNIDVPADISSAAFFMVAASIVPDSDITLINVGINPTRIGVINILQKMGANIELINERKQGGEPVADIVVRYAPLTGIEIPADQVPLAIDEFPVLFIAAACASGETILHNAKELRVKETDRIAAMAAGLTQCGIDHEVYDDGIRITGGSIQGADVESFGDHRIAMSFAIAGLVSQGSITIKNCDNVATSFPSFVQLGNQLGCELTVVN